MGRCCIRKELVVTALPLYHIFALTINCLLFIELGGRTCLSLTRVIFGVGKRVSEISVYRYHWR